jgi:hypothetical protein
MASDRFSVRPGTREECWDFFDLPPPTEGTTLGHDLRTKVRKKYRELALNWHPDKCDGGDASFKNIQAAYEVAYALPCMSLRFPFHSHSCRRQSGMSCPVKRRLMNSMTPSQYPMRTQYFPSTPITSNNFSRTLLMSRLIV